MKIPVWLKAALTVAVLAAVAVAVDLRAVFAHLRMADLGWICIALVCLTTSTLLMAWRWRVVARALGVSFSYPWALREYYLCQLANQVLPGGIMGDAARALRAKPFGGFKPALASVVIERVMGQMALLILVGLGLGWVAAMGSPIAWPSWLVPAGLSAAVVLTVCVLWSLRDQRVASVLRLLPLAQSAAIAAALSLSFYACARAVGVALPLEALLTLIPLVLSAMLIPLSIGGWGWREGAAALLFPLAGATGSSGVAASVVYGAVMLLAALPAVVFLLSMGSGRDALKVPSQEPKTENAS